VLIDFQKCSTAQRLICCLNSLKTLNWKFKFPRHNNCESILISKLQSVAYHSKVVKIGSDFDCNFVLPARIKYKKFKSFGVKFWLFRFWIIAHKTIKNGKMLPSRSDNLSFEVRLQIGAFLLPEKLFPVKL